MGAGRDLTFAVFAEGVLVLVAVARGAAGGWSTDLLAMSDAAAGADIWGEPLHWCAALAFALVALTEAGASPSTTPTRIWSSRWCTRARCSSTRVASSRACSGPPRRGCG